jgi:hypothetical protein
MRSVRQRKVGAIYIPEQTTRSVAALVEYLWSDELQDFQGRTPEARNGHVFRDLVIIRRWLKRIGVSTKN